MGTHETRVVQGEPEKEVLKEGYMQDIGMRMGMRLALRRVPAPSRGSVF